MDCELNSLTELETAEKAISSAGSANHQGNSSNQKNHNKRCHPKIKGYFQTFLSCFLLLAIIGLIVVIILHSTKLNGRIQLLESQIERIEASLGNNDSTSAVAAVLQAQQMALHLEASLTSLNASLVTMGTHGQQLSAMVASNISELRHHLQDLEANLVNSSLRQRFTGCYEDRQLCTILPVEEDLFFRGCRTHTIPANISVSYLNCTPDFDIDVPSI